MVEPAVDGDAFLGPELAQHGHLFFQPFAPGGEVVSQGLVLDGVPADAQPQTEAAVADEVELGHLLGQEGGLALGSDEDGGGETQPGDAGQVGEEDQRLMERGVDVVGATDVAVHRGVGPQDVVVRRQVVVAQIRGGLPVGAHGAQIAADLGLRKDHSYIHRASLPAPTPTSPASPVRRRGHRV